MNSAPLNTIQISGKSSNAPSLASHNPPIQTHVAPPTFESTGRRANSSSHFLQAPRNSQNIRNKHKNQRRPRLADEDAIAESGAMRNATSRKGQTSITHLMNFTLPPRPQYSSTSYSRGTRRNPTYGLGSGHHASDKARYIHANYRFIVNPTSNYHSHAIDADLHLEWSNVLQILASAESQSSSCPICLSHPVAPRMAKCGHIFCLPCLKRYMHSTDETEPVPEKRARWKKCPICWDSIYMSDTKPVRWFTGQEGPAPREGEDVVLRLVMRQPGSTLALPRDGADPLGKNEDVPWYFAAEVADYARIMKGGEEYMIAQHDAEIAQLFQQEKEDEMMFGEESEWTRKAVGAINEAKAQLAGIGNPPESTKHPAEKKIARQPIQFITDEEVPEACLQTSTTTGRTSSNDQLPRANGQSSLEARSNPFGITRPPIQEAHHPDSPFFFYQALLHYYLAPLDIRILKAAFGSFASFPSTLLPRVERVSTGHIVDDDLRRRTKYLAHLPHGCEVGFLECDWTDVVQPEILSTFSEEIEKRRRKNKEKETREEKDRQRAERLEDSERWATARRTRTSVAASSFSADEFVPLVASSLDAAAASPPWQARHGSSFGALASPGTSPAASRTVWGTSVVAPPSPELHGHGHAEGEGGDDGWLQDWERELVEENELIAQIREASLNGESSAAGFVSGALQAGGGTGTGTGGGKKKKKKITLMSTNARRAA